MISKNLIYFIIIISFCSLQIVKGEIPENNEISKDRNYIRTVTVLTYDNNNIDDYIDQVQYFDGLGRLIQTINVNGSPLGNDIIQPVVYDEFGRLKKEYLPYTDGNGGEYRDINQVVETAQPSFYEDYFPGQGQYAFSEKEFDNSPLNRILKQGAPGESWQLDSRPVHLDYSTNKPGDVIQWKIEGGKPVADGTYPGGNLYLTVAKDENWTEEKGKLHTTEEYTNKDDNTVLTRSWVKNQDDELTDVSTYYVYDDFELLRFVIPPKAIEDGNLTTEKLDGLCYQYKYDGRRRMTEKKLPGADKVYMVYDKRDRLVFAQDGNQRNNFRWSYIKYDNLNREVETGIYVHDNADIAREDMQELVNNNNPVNMELNGSYKALTKFYYDDYSFNSENFIEGVDTDDYNNDSDFPQDDVDFDNVRNRITGSSTLIMDTTYSTQWLNNVNYYDEYGRIVRSFNNNQLGGYDIILNKYNFAGAVVKSKHIHKIKDNDEITLKRSYDYDHSGRLTKVSMQVDENDEFVLSKTEYNELSQLKEKKLHDNIISNTFEYNIRGWLTKLNEVGGAFEFGMELKYDDVAGDDNKAQYNGNIAKMNWQSKENNRSYGYSYDALSRLKEADFMDMNDSDADYSVRDIQYDVNGNILSLTRKGLCPDTTFITLDSLIYAYYESTNKLQQVSDSAFNRSDWVDFLSRPGEIDTTSEGNYNDYFYDANANMIIDYNKAIYDTIGYNHLNLPESITIAGGRKNINYIWDAVGNKLSTRTAFLKDLPDDTLETTRTEYIGNFVYKEDDQGNLKPAYILHEEGMIVVDDDGDYHYDYYIKDHLGNTRLVQRVTGETTETIQQTDYYPFGMIMGGRDAYPGDDDNKYLYNNKELQDMFDLGWYDYGARFYDAEIGRFHTIDPLTEKNHRNTPYSYAANNPIIYIDWLGLDTVYVFDQATRPDDNAAYTAEMYVIIDGEIYGPYESSSFPDDDSANTLNEGEYDYNNLYGHAGGSRKGLNIVNEDGDRVAPGTTADGEDVDEPGMLYVNVHDSFRDGGRYSEGCPTIPHGDPEGVFDHFDWSGTYNSHTGTTGTSTGTLILQRGENANTARSVLRSVQSWRQNPPRPMPRQPVPVLNN